MSEPASRPKPGRAPDPPVATRFPPGVSGNPSGRSKEIARVETLAREMSEQALAELARIGKGRGVPAVRANELILAYGLGRPQHQIAITAKGGAPLNGAFAGAARAMLEAAIERAETGGTVTQTVALESSADEKPSNGAVIDVIAVEADPARGSDVAAPTEKGTES